ncbi:hypothetical protein BCR36DRAFT_414797 [Piromyces finnis]|uniref:Uncharacterized protein n=1 Tax=Piromyces finnis TaxID=1754191 RepID=A0A1Y1V0X6_9FUNG|nr:hypothetical protein BCR36DRAFT_414797 [Piromyces finnis]|eukprot:ORX44825.1 hypothetical protein BCR36DRAFT_414797 [Piromyces finnis]
MNINTQDFNMDNLHEMFMNIHLSENGVSPLQIPSASSPFGNVNFPQSSPNSNNGSPTDILMLQQQQNQQIVYQEAVNRPEDVQMGENGLTAYEEQMLFLQMQDQLYQQIEDERLRLQQM